MGVSKVGQREFFSLKTPFITEETSGFEKKRKDFFKTKISWHNIIPVSGIQRWFDTCIAKWSLHKDLFSVSLSLVFVDFTRQWDHTVFVCVWLISLSRPSSGSICITANGKTPFSWLHNIPCASNQAEAGHMTILSCSKAKKQTFLLSEGRQLRAGGALWKVSWHQAGKALPFFSTNNDRLPTPLMSGLPSVPCKPIDLKMVARQIFPPRTRLFTCAAVLTLWHWGTPCVSQANAGVR